MSPSIIFHFHFLLSSYLLLHQKLIYFKTPWKTPLDDKTPIFLFRLLIDNGADVASVNNEGELPLDLAEDEEMEDLLTDEIERLGEYI